MAREKKFFAPELRTYNNNIRKRWRVEYWASKYKRVVLYGHINRGKTVEDRLRLGFELINSLSFDKPIEKNILEKVIETATLTLRPKTISAYTTVSDRFKDFLGKKGSPETATEETINNFLLHSAKSGIIQNTIAKYRNTLYTLYEKARATGLCSYNPVVKVPGIRRRPKSLMFFSDAQIVRFKEADMPPQLWLGIRFLFYCFIRPGEMRLMKIGMINFDYGFIEVPGEISKNGKTEKVAIPKHFQKEIEYLREYPGNFYILSKTGAPGLTPVSTKYLNDEHKKVLDALKIRGRYAYYSWKHTGAVKAVKAGINIKDLQLQLRHHSLDMVNEYLKNLGVMDSEDLREKFPEI